MFTSRKVLSGAAGLVLAATIATTPSAGAAPSETTSLPFRTLPDLRVDANRDGAISFDTTDDVTSAKATLTDGAIFLPNLDDDGRRCAGKGVTCHDASDNIVNGADDEADLARIVLAPTRELAEGARGVVHVDTAAQKHVRLFLQNGDTWTHITPETLLTKEQLEAGVTLGIEGTDVMRPGTNWDGTAQVTVTITSGGYTAHDHVSLQQAPLLTHSHVQKAERIVAAPAPHVPGLPGAKEFTDDLGKAVATAGVPEGLQLVPSNDIWIQDWMEPGYASMPSTNGTQSMRLLIRSDQGRELKQLLAFRGPNVGVVETGGNGQGRTRSSFGNLETAPPHTANGTTYPAGRTVMGFGDKDNNPIFLDHPSEATQSLIAAQGMQDMIKVDTSWLFVGHIDEFMQFLPANNNRGFTLAVADPESVIKVLKKAAADGHGAEPAGSRGKPSTMTIDQLLADKDLMAANSHAVKEINKSLATLKKELELSDADIVRIPTFYEDSTWLLDGEGGGGDDSTVRSVGHLKLSQALAGNSALAQAIRDAKASRSDAPRSGEDDADPFEQLLKDSLGAYYPGAINSVVTSPHNMAVAKQFGPVVNGEDILATAVTDAYAAQGMTVSFVDDYELYHLGQGEVHCGSNSFRDTTNRWW